MRQPREAAVRIDNFGRINERYYRGALPDAQDLADLARLGVKTTIHLTNGDGDSAEEQPGGGRGDEVRQDRDGHAGRADGQQIADVPEHRQRSGEPAGVRALRGGKHRTGVMTAIYRMVHHSRTPDRAFKEMKTYKFGADFLHPEFKTFVLAFKGSPVRVDVPDSPSSSQELRHPLLTMT